MRKSDEEGPRRVSANTWIGQLHLNALARSASLMATDPICEESGLGVAYEVGGVRLRKLTCQGLLELALRVTPGVGISQNSRCQAHLLR